jgi:hypothetical protein
VGVAVKVTDAPEQTLVELAAILTAAAVVGFTVIVTDPVSGDTVQPLLAMEQVTTSPLVREEEE